ncbi:hypothetical protein QBC44DRAFT_386888 [Cladorrhinum sp. PSN332]|nr:hypothetical protein QBC44DRAFT_386888 [Cladorrhinum sp. PSN332]
MATAAVASASHPWTSIDVAATLGGLPFQEKDFILSSDTYNGLLPIEKQVRLQDSHASHIKALIAIINKHGMADFFGIHSLHRYDSIPEKTNRATPITDQLLAQQTHVTLLKVQGTGLVPLEFAESPSPIKADAIPMQFMVDMLKYLSENDLTNLIAIDVGDFTKAGAAGGAHRTAELEVVWGTQERLTVVLPLDRMVEGASNPVPTGWNAQNYNADADPPAGEHWNEAKKSDGSITHKVHVDSTSPLTPQGLILALTIAGFCKA